jgi:hypothetical protein
MRRRNAVFGFYAARRSEAAECGGPIAVCLPKPMDFIAIELKGVGCLLVYMLAC